MSGSSKIAHHIYRLRRRNRFVWDSVLVDLRIDIRASDIPKWLECPEKMRALDPFPPTYDRVRPVALEVVNAVHRHVAGYKYAPARHIAFDKNTPTDKEMKIQVRDMTRIAKEFLKKSNYEIVDSEITKTVMVKMDFEDIIYWFRIRGTLDFLVSNGQKTGLVDLKTGGIKPLTSMPQIAVYCWLCKKQGIDVDFAGYLWIERTTRANPQTHQQFEDGPELAQLGHKYVQFVVKSLWGGGGTTSSESDWMRDVHPESLSCESAMNSSDWREQSGLSREDLANCLEVCVQQIDCGLGQREAPSTASRPSRKSARFTISRVVTSLRTTPTTSL